MVAVVAASAAFVVVGTAEAQGRRRATPRIAVVSDGPSDAARRTTALLAQEVTPLLERRFPDLEFPAEPTHAGDFSEERATGLIREVLDDAEIDLVVVVGFLAGKAVGEVERLPKPVFLPFAAPALQGLPREGERSGRENLAYLTGLIDLERELRRFQEVMRRGQAAFLMDRYLHEAVPQADEILQRASGDVDAQVVPVEDSADQILAAIPENTQSVFLGPLIRLPDAEIQPLIDGLNARRLPTYASEGRSWVERGAFTSVTPETEDARRMRRVALDIQAVLLEGARASTLSTVFEPRAELVINMATARQIGVWPRFELMTEAVLVGQDEGRHRGPELSLRQAVQMAVDRNFEYLATRRDRLIAETQFDEAVGGWLPGVDLSGDFTWLDPDVTSALGSAERQLSFGAQVQQLLFSARALAGVDSTDANRSRVEHAIRTAELDLVADTASAYLNLLRARTAERITRENLSRTRRNLSLAEIRVGIGSAKRDEVFRWQIEIADGRAEVIGASATRNQAEIAVNRFMNRDLEAAFVVIEPAEPDEQVMIDPRIAQYVEDPWSFRVFREFMAKEALNNSPELREVNAAILAESATLRGQRQSLFIPDLFLTGGVSHVVSRTGSGSEEFMMDIAGIASRDDFTWQLGVALQFPLFDGARYPQIERSRQTVAQLNIQRDSIAQLVEQRVRSALHQAGASRAAVLLRREAAEAAESNLEMVVDAYRRGSVDIIRLIDGQNQALVTRLAAANALYDFLLDFIEVERAGGRFGFLQSPADLEDFVVRLTAFARERDRNEASGDDAAMDSAVEPEGAEE